MRRLWLCAASVALLAGRARGDEEPAIAELRAQVEQALRENRPDDIDNLVEIAARKASAANRPLRLGRLELFGCEVEADNPSPLTVEHAQKALLHLGEDPDAKLAAVRLHTAGAMVALGAGRIGSAALHLQLARAAIERVPSLAKPAAGAGKMRLGVPDPRRDQARLDEVEREILVRLRQGLVAHHGDVSSLPPGYAAVIASYTSGQPLRASANGNEPLPPRAPPAGEGTLARLDRTLARAEERAIAAADGRGDGIGAAAARSRHADTLLRTGRPAEALAARRQALAFYREHGTIEQVATEARWIAEHASGDRRALLDARREEVREIEHQLQKVVGPARTAARAAYRRDYLALFEAAQRIQGERVAGRAAAVALVEPVDLLRERSVWDQAALLADGARWRRLGGGAPRVRRLIESLARETGARPADGVALDFSSPQVRARQAAMDAMARGDPPLVGTTPLDGQAVADRLGSRSLVVFGRIDPRQLAVGVVPGEGRGPPRLLTLPVTLAEEADQVLALRRALREGGDRWHAPARALYASLIAPIEPQLGDAAVVVPDDALAALPFAALEDAGGRLLGQRVTFSLAPTLAALSAPRVAPVERTAAIVIGVSRFGDPGVKALPWAEREADAIRATLEAAGRKVKLLPGTGGPAALLAEAGSVDVVHLATRARLDPEVPLVGRLLFGTAPLFSFDLGNLALRTNVLVIDAIPAAAAELSAGAEARALSGLAGGALQGSARTVVLATLASEGPAAAVLFSRFYERCAMGQSPSGALASAQREMAAGAIEQPLFLRAGANPIADRSRFTHPRYWAGYAMWGEP